MKTLYKILSVFAIPSIILLYSYSAGSPGGKTGSPIDGSNCTECHTGTPNTAQGWISSNIPGDGYVPGQTYTITATGTHTGVVKFGFELTAEDGSGKSGTLLITDATRTKFTNGNAAITHTSAGTAPSGNTNTWSMDWTAPAEGHGTVTFYAAFNAANGINGNQGDVIYTSSTPVNEYIPPSPEISFVDPDHAEQGWILTVTITGDNTSWQRAVPVVTFKYHDDNEIIIEGTNVEVKSETELTADLIIPLDQMIGSYDVWVDDLSLEDAFMVDIASGIEDDILASRINIYPNPASEYVLLDLPEASQFSLIDITGRQILSRTSATQIERVDVSALESGIYFIQIIHDGNTATKRLLKN